MMAPHEGLEKCQHRVCETGKVGSGGDSGKIKWKLSEVNIRAVSRGQDK